MKISIYEDINGGWWWQLLRRDGNRAAHNGAYNDPHEALADALFARNEYGRRVIQLDFTRPCDPVV